MTAIFKRIFVFLAYPFAISALAAALLAAWPLTLFMQLSIYRDSEGSLRVRLGGEGADHEG